MLVERRWRTRLTKYSAGASPERWLLILAVPALLIAAPWILSDSRLVALAIVAGINAIVLYGLAVLFGLTGILSIAHAALWGIGAYTAGILLRDLGWSFWAALPYAAVMAGVAAGLLGYPALRVKGHHFLIVTFAFGELLKLVLKNGGDFTGRGQGILILEGVPPAFGLTFTSSESFYFLVIFFLLLTIAAVYLLGISRLGRTLRAIRENEDLARSVGINTNAYKIGAFVISGALTGVAGALYLYYLRSVSPELFGAFPGVQMAMMLLLGGSRVLLGPLSGAIIVGFLPEIINLDPIESQITFGVLLILVILVLPQGLVAGAQSRYIWLKSRLVALVRQRPAVTMVESAGWEDGSGEMGREDDDDS